MRHPSPTARSLVRTSGLTARTFTSPSVVARNNDILKKLVLEAKRLYEKDAEHRVHIFMADSYVRLPYSDGAS